MKIIELEQGSQEWLDFRRKHVTATDATSIMGANPYKTSYKLWGQKMGLIAEEEINDAMRRGMELEPIARDVFNERAGFFMKPVVVKHDKIDYMAASLDGFCNATGMALEIKCPRGDDFHCAMEGKIPAKYYPQLQHQMCVTGLRMIYYFTYNPPYDKMLICERDDKYIADLLQKEAEFWKSLQNLEPPEMTNKDYVSREDIEWVRKATHYKFLKEQIEQNQLALQQIKEELVHLAGSSATIGGGLRCCKLLRRGNIDYSSIPELKQVDLEKYRKPAIEYWRVSDDN